MMNRAGWLDLLHRLEESAGLSDLQRAEVSAAKMELVNPEPGDSPAVGGERFPWHVKRELERAREQHGVISSTHAAYAIILEEVDELWAEVRQKNPNKSLLMEELVQIGAMAQRVAEDLKLEGWYRPA